MTRAESVHSTPPTNAPIADDPVHAATETYRPALPPRVPTAQERADGLLRRWRLARAAGIPADRRLIPQHVLADLFEELLVQNPERAAAIIIERLLDAGFEIVSAEERT